MTQKEQTLLTSINQEHRSRTFSIVIARLLLSRGKGHSVRKKMFLDFQPTQSCSRDQLSLLMRVRTKIMGEEQ